MPQLPQLPEGGLPRRLHGGGQGGHRPYPVRGLHRLRSGLPLRCHRKGGSVMSGVKSALLVGVGGQGAILISKIMANGLSLIHI